MAVMKFEIVHVNEVDYIGYKVEVPIRDVSSVDFQSLWKKVMKQFPILDEEFYIGYEDYASFNGKSYFYFALAPKRKGVKYTNVEHITIPSGRYYKYESVYSKHGQEFFETMYRHLKRKGVRHDSTYDLEILPASFTYDNPDSILYVAVKEIE